VTVIVFAAIVLFNDRFNALTSKSIFHWPPALTKLLILPSSSNPKNGAIKLAVVCSYVCCFFAPTINAEFGESFLSSSPIES